MQTALKAISLQGQVIWRFWRTGSRLVIKLCQNVNDDFIQSNGRHIWSQWIFFKVLNSVSLWIERKDRCVSCNNTGVVCWPRPEENVMGEAQVSIINLKREISNHNKWDTGSQQLKMLKMKKVKKARNKFEVFLKKMGRIEEIKGGARDKRL